MTTKLTPHPLAEIIHAVADGRTVQYCTSIDWINYTGRSSTEPQLAHPSVNWRIKPETVRYRPFLMHTATGGDAIAGVCNDWAYNECGPYLEPMPGFIRWLDGWKEEEI